MLIDFPCRLKVWPSRSAGGCEDFQYLSNRICSATTPRNVPPSIFVTSARVPKFVDSINLNSKLALFAAEPSAKLTADITGISGKELTRVIPSLAQFLDGNSLSGGKVHSEIDSTFIFTRRGMMGIDLTRDITSNFSVKKHKLLARRRGKTICLRPGNQRRKSKALADQWFTGD